MDPEQFFRYRVDIAKASASGLEAFAYKLMPFNMIRSVAFAIDPFSALKLSAKPITPWNRKKYLAKASVLNNRVRTRRDIQRSESSIVNYENIPGRDGPVVANPTGDYVSTLELSAQEVIPDTLEDTTKRTRLIGSETGELRKFSGVIYSPPRLVSYNYSFEQYSSESMPPQDYPRVSNSYESLTYESSPTGATLSKSTSDAIKNTEEQLALAYMQEYALPMYKGLHPGARTYTGFRNLVELRDLPRSISSLRDTARNLMKLETSLKMSSSLSKKLRSSRPLVDDIPKQYLSYHFGWKLLVKDAFDLMAAPSKISKRINFLLRRNGKPTTVRSSRKFLLAETGVSGFEYNYMPQERGPVEQSSRIDREMELRMVLNFTFRFPDVNVPEFIGKLYRHQLGLNPRPIDIYNLVPWTWLIDWYTGLGNYLEVIDIVSTDDTLINWGFLTCETKGKLTSEIRTKSDDYKRTLFNSVNTVIEPERSNTHSSVYEYNFQLRKDLSNIMAVKSTEKPFSLTAYQQSILGAIIAQSGKFRFR
jgi:hypothetical protein